MQNVIEIFKTNVEEAKDATKLVALLLEHFPESRINFDLEDCDKILRFEGINFSENCVRNVLYTNGFACSILS